MSEAADSSPTEVAQKSCHLTDKAPEFLIQGHCEPPVSLVQEMEVDTQPFCVERDPEGKALLNAVGEKELNRCQWMTLAKKSGFLS